MSILGPSGQPIKTDGNVYMFAIKGQIFELSDTSFFESELTEDMKKELVEETTLQVAFMEALKTIMGFWHAKKGLHPNVKELTVFEKEDQERVDAMKRTLGWFSKLEKPITSNLNIKDLRDKAASKMFDSISEMPDAWTEDGKLKPEFAEKYRSDMLN